MKPYTLARLETTASANWQSPVDGVFGGGSMQMIDNQRSYEPRLDGDDDILDLMRVTSVTGGEPRSGQLTGAKGLMLAVLEDGIRCYLGHKKRIAIEAELWIASQRRHTPFSFVVVCETLGLNPDAVRARLVRMRAANLPARQVLPRSRNNVRVPGQVQLRKRRRRSA
jgi:hypothetical protein